MARTFDSGNTQRLRSDFTYSDGFPLSISVCFRDTDGSNAASSDRCILQVQDSSNSGRYLRVGKNSSTLALYGASRWDLGGDNGCISAGTYSADVWNHCLFTASSSSRRDIWLNNASQGTNTVEWGTPTGIDSITIGYEDDSSPGDPWNGDIAEAAMWNAELGADERAALSMGFSPLFIRPQNLVFYAPLINGSGNDKSIWGDNADILTANGTGTIGETDHPKMFYPKGFLGNYFSTGGGSISVTADIVTRISWANELFRNNIAQIDWASKLENAQVISTEASLNVVSEHEKMIAWASELFIDEISNVEWAQNVASSKNHAVSWATEVIGDRITDVEWASLVEITKSQPAEWVSILEANRTNAIGWASELLVDKILTTSFSSDVLINSVMPVSWTSDVDFEASRIFPIEWTSLVTTLQLDRLLPLEYASKVQTETVYDIEWSGQIILNKSLPVEYANLLNGESKNIPISWETEVIGNMITNLEWKGFVDADRLMNVAFAANIESDAISQINWASEVGTIITNPVAWLTSIGVSKNILIDWDGADIVFVDGNTKAVWTLSKTGTSWTLSKHKTSWKLPR